MLLHRVTVVASPIIVAASLFVVMACDSPLHPSAPSPATTAVPAVPAAPQRAAPSGSAVAVSTPPAPSSAIEPLVGRYDLDLVIGDCDSLPDDVKHRRYTATFVSDRSGNFEVTLSEASFLQNGTCFWGGGNLCNWIFSAYDDFASRSGFDLYFEFLGGPPFTSKPIVEQLPGGAWLEWAGFAGGKLADGTISASGDQIAVSYWYGEPVGSSYVACRSDKTRLTFTPR